MVAVRNGRALVRRVDATQRAIVSGLRQLHYEVYEIEEPCDLLVYYFSNKHQCFRWQPLECKALDAKGRLIRKRGSQADQTEFLERTGTPVVTSLDGAIQALEAA